MVALTELLTVIVLASHQSQRWKGKVVLYMGDNQVVVAWLKSRQAKQPMATYLLQLLAALEESYGFGIHPSYVRTYHNKVADALTREDPVQVMTEAGLTPMEGAAHCLSRFLERGWQRRALIWAGQADADQGQALRLAESRTPSKVPSGLSETPNALDLIILEVGKAPKRYEEFFLSCGAQLHSDEERNLQGLKVLCMSLTGENLKEELDVLTRMIEAVQPALVWVDSRHYKGAVTVTQRLGQLGPDAQVVPLCGRSFKDQVWWKRWVVTWSREGAPCSFNGTTADDEPTTAIPAGFKMDWLCEDHSVSRDSWEKGLLKLDSAMPFLGATKPKPCATFIPESEPRRLVWDPRQPLPGLHEHSWDSDHPDRLLLLGKGPDGPAVRALTPPEAVLLLHGKRDVSVGSNSALPAVQHLAAAPRKLAEACLGWCVGWKEENGSHQTSHGVDKVGACYLKWEEETRKILGTWLRDNPTPERPCDMVGGRSVSGSTKGQTGNMGKGGRKSRGKGSKPLTPLERCSKAMSRLLRHEAGTRECPISEEGWVRWTQMLEHPLMQPFQEWDALQALQGNDKDRFISKPDTDGEWWIGAWSGHTIDGVTGPSVVVESSAVPKVLVHGSYRRHSGSIQRQGVLRGRRDIHLHDPDEHSEKWRKDIETKIVVDTVVAAQAGCQFHKTGNQVWLCSENIPKFAIIEIVPWHGLKVGAARRAPGLHHGTGEWAPSEEARRTPLVTEEVAQVAREIAANLPETEGAIEVSVETSTIHECAGRGPETRFASGVSSECDWSSSDSSSVECVQAIPAKAASSSTSVKDGTRASEGGSSQPRWWPPGCYINRCQDGARASQRWGDRPRRWLSRCHHGRTGDMCSILFFEGHSEE